MPKMFANLNTGTATNAGQETVDINVVGGDFTGGGGTTAWADITGKPTTFPATIDATATGAVAGNDPRLSVAAAATASVRALGTAATNAAAGNHTHTVSQVTDLTAAKLMTGSITAVNNSAAAPTQTEFNALLAALRTRGIISGS